MSTKQPAVYKKNGVRQRGDTKLTLEVARALETRVRQTGRVYPKGERIELPMPDGTTCKLSVNTLEMWITRRNVVPETGETLRDVLDKARETYRMEKYKAEQKQLLLDAQREIKRTLNLRTNLVARTMFGEVIKNEDGSIVRKENAQLLKVKMSTAHFVAERLDPETYGEKTQTKNEHLVFSLNDLRRAKQGNTEETEAQN